MPARICTQDLRTLFRAREIVERLTANELAAAIETARSTLSQTKGRQRYLREMLPGGLAHAIPGPAETFEIECADRRQFRLQDSSMSLLWQIMNLERQHATQAVRIIRHNGHGRQEYWL